MPALSPTMEKGNLAKWLKKEGDTRQIRRRHRRDRDRQSHHGSGSGRRRHARQDPGAGRHRRRRGQYADRHDPRRRRGCLRAQGRQRPRSRPRHRSSRRRAESAPPAEKAEPAKQAEAPAPAKTGTAKPPPRQVTPEPEVPEGTEMVTMTMREALRDAMAEEMRRDQDVFVMGEEVAEYQGAYKVTQGLLGGIRRPARHRHADHRAWLCRPRRRRGARRPKADRRIHDLQFRHAGDGSAHQFGREDALHVRRAGGLLDRVSRAERRRPRASPPSTARIIRPGTRTFPA